jgi:S-adenosylmethionine:tRNA ribosyltransferase-isomerase
MQVSELLYDLPEAAIAQQPIEPRDAARLLVAVQNAAPRHLHVRDLAQFVVPGDIFVVNDTKVLRARLHLRKATGGSVEVFLLAPRDDSHSTWEALVRPGKRVPAGTELFYGDTRAVVVGEVLDEDGTRSVEFAGAGPPDALIAEIGDVPLPPYIHERLTDPDRYQTVYARTPGSVAAPTAGLHLTDAVLDACRAAGAEIATVTLDVGLGTFRPMASGKVEDHHMHAESYFVPDATVAALARARRVIAVGTTSLRCLESFAATGERRGSTELFIHGDYPFKVVDVLMTNFHLPGSSLLALLDAFAGPRWRDLYALALLEGYRFLSFGDAMLVDRRDA